MPILFAKMKHTVAVHGDLDALGENLFAGRIDLDEDAQPFERGAWLRVCPLMRADSARSAHSARSARPARSARCATPDG